MCDRGGSGQGPRQETFGQKAQAVRRPTLRSPTPDRRASPSSVTERTVRTAEPAAQRPQALVTYIYIYTRSILFAYSSYLRSYVIGTVVRLASTTEYRIFFVLVVRVESSR
jgi:hypothetical protein